MFARICLVWFSLLVSAAAQELVLVKRLPLSELKPPDIAVLKFEPGGVTFRYTPNGEDIHNEYGFVRIGSCFVFYTGIDGMAVDPGTGQVSKAVPSNLVSAKVSLSGEVLVGLLKGEKMLWLVREGVERQRKAAPWTVWMHLGWIHPSDQVFFAPDDAKRYPYQPYGFKGVEVVDMSCDRILARVPLSLPESPAMVPSGDGTLALGNVVPYTSFWGQDLRTSEWIKFELPFEYTGGYVFNRDASWVAGKKGANDWSTFVWDRINKRFLWKDPMVSEPSAFSPNGKLIYCCDTINEAATGKAVFENLQGYNGKFSPDGRSLVTVDDEAFYIYTLPKESEAIFGVFQRPEPWSPPGGVKPAKHPVKKPIRKP